jgi:hypothetical protein
MLEKFNNAVLDELELFIDEVVYRTESKFKLTLLSSATFSFFHIKISDFVYFKIFLEQYLESLLADTMIVF